MIPAYRMGGVSTQRRQCREGSDRQPSPHGLRRISRDLDEPDYQRGIAAAELSLDGVEDLLGCCLALASVFAGANGCYPGALPDRAINLLQKQAQQKDDDANTNRRKREGYENYGQHEFHKPLPDL